MKTAFVTCWKTGPNRALFITYPEAHMGHDLLCCTRCGTVHAARVSIQLYCAPDLDEYLQSVACSNCDQQLGGNWAHYPETYMDETGELKRFVRSNEFPDDSESIVVEFPDVFDGAEFEPIQRTEGLPLLQRNVPIPDEWIQILFVMAAILGIIGVAVVLLRT